MIDAEQIDAFCSALLGGPDGSGDDRLDGWSTYVWTLDQGRPRPAKTTLWTPAQPGALAEVLRTEALRQPQQLKAVYLSLGMAPDEVIRDEVARRDGSTAPMNRRRFEADDVRGIPALWADLDILGPGHKGTAYPPDIDAALSITGALNLPPSIVVHSGGGLQAYWLFDEPWLATDAADPAAEQRVMAELSRDLINTLRYHAQRLGGWTVDSVFNLDRVMRAPGSLNTKNDPPVPVRILSLDASVRYGQDEIREHLASDEVLKGFATRTMSGGASVDLAEQLPGVDLLAAWERVQIAPKHTPEWLAAYLEMVPGSPFEATWEHDRPDLGGDENRFDASMVRLLANDGVGEERQAEAIMARRVRAGVNVDKVDPRVRPDYLVRTLINIRDQVAASKAVTDKRGRVLADAVASAASATLTDLADPPAPVAEQPSSTPTPDPVPSPPVTTIADDAADDGPAEDIPPWEVAPEPESDELAEAANEIIAGPPESPAEPTPVRQQQRVVATEQIKRERAADPEPPPRDDPWSVRSEATEAILGMLGELLIPDPYRERGVSVWSLEQRDRGPSTVGRLVLRLPTAMDWPNGHRPPLYRPGLPFYCEWYKRDDFEVPRGFRRSLERDAKVTARQVGDAKEDWIELISALVPYWGPDSSQSDLTSQMHEWLLEYLLERPATTLDTEALTAGRPLLVDHAEWGVRGAPEILVPHKSLLDYIATQPGGRAGREAKGLLAHLRVQDRRPRIANAEGVTTRSRWLYIEADQFSAQEWAEVLEVARQWANSREGRRLRSVNGGRA